MSVPETDNKHEDRGDSSFDQSQREAIDEKTSIGRASWCTKNDNGPQDANDRANDPARVPLREERDRVRPSNIPEVEDEGDPGIFETIFEFQVFPKTKNGGLA